MLSIVIAGAVSMALQLSIKVIASGRRISAVSCFQLFMLRYTQLEQIKVKALCMINSKALLYTVVSSAAETL